MKDDVENKIISIIQNNCSKIKKEHIKMDSDIRSLSLDSIGLVKLIVAIENEFSFEFDDADLNLNKFILIKDLAEYCSARI